MRSLPLRTGLELRPPAVQSGLLPVVGFRPADLHAEQSTLLHGFLERLTAPGAIALKNENKGVAAPAQPDGLAAWKWGTAGAAGGNSSAYRIYHGRGYEHRPNPLYDFLRNNPSKKLV